MATVNRQGPKLNPRIKFHAVTSTIQTMVEIYFKDFSDKICRMTDRQL